MIEIAQDTRRYGIPKIEVDAFLHQLTHIIRDCGALTHEYRVDAVAGAVAHFRRTMMMDVDQAAKAMRDEEMLAEIEDFLGRFNQPTYRGMRGQWGLGADLVEPARLEWALVGPARTSPRQRSASPGSARVLRRNAAFEEDAMRSWGVLPSDNTVWWVILWIVMTAFFAGAAWFIMVAIDYYVVLPARTEFAIWVGLTWLLIWQVGARIAAHERRRFGRS